MQLTGARGNIPLEVNGALDETGNRTVARLTFLNRAVRSAFPPDGRYTLTIDSDRITDGAGQRLDADSDGMPGGEAVEEFFRLFGDGAAVMDRGEQVLF